MGAAVAIATACGRAVESTADRTEQSQTFVNPDGTATFKVSSVPQRVHRSDGSWVAVDTTLHAVAGGWQPVASAADVTFSDGGTTPLVTWREHGHMFTVSWPSPLPAPTVSGDTAVYAVFPDVDLTVTASRTGYSHALVVKTAAAAANPAVQQAHYLLGGDLQVQANADGGLSLRDGSGAEVATSHAPAMWDSTFDPAAAGEVLPGVTPAQAASASTTIESEETSVDDGLTSSPIEPGIGAVTAPVEVAVNGNEMIVTANPVLLSDPDATFPIFIDPPLNNLRSKWAYADSGDVNNNNDSRMWVGHNEADGRNYRSYFEFDVSALRGKTIISAEVDAVLDHSYSCDDTWVHLYRPGGNITVASGGRMAWSTRPLGSLAAAHLDAWEGHANEAGGCGTIQPDMPAIFDSVLIKPDLQAAATANWTIYTLGLCACNETDQYESTQDRWKKFYNDKTYLVVTYDLKPNAPTAQPLSTTTDCYKACTSPAVVRTTQPTLTTTVSDPYGGQLRTLFEVRAAASDTATLVTDNSTALVTTTTSGSATGTASWQVPTGKLVNKTTYYWRARTYDENNLTGDWSAWQTLSVDATAPQTPTAESSQYPEKQWGSVVGTAGQFTFSELPPYDKLNPNAVRFSDVVEFTWWVDGQGGTTTTAATMQTGCETTCSALATVSFNPATDMVKTMHVKALDAAGNVGPTIDYQFWVSPLANRCWHWKLNEASGTTATDSGNTDSTDPVCAPIGTSVTPMPGTLAGNVAFSTGYLGNAAIFTGTGGQITTGSAVVDTTKSFSVAAWVNPSSLAADATIISQDGVNASGFQLNFDKQANSGAGGWCFTVRPSDSTTVTPVATCADGQTVGLPATGTWVHVAGIYDATTGAITVHVSGGSESCAGETNSTTFTTPWSATGSLAIGRAETGEAWLGGIDAVHAYTRALSTTDICKLALQ